MVTHMLVEDVLEGLAHLVLAQGVKEAKLVNQEDKIPWALLVAGKHELKLGDVDLTATKFLDSGQAFLLDAGVVKVWVVEAAKKLF